MQRRLLISKKMKKAREERKAYIQQQQDFLSKVKLCETKESNATQAVKFLHAACGALQELEIIMKRAAIFWMKLQQHCKDLADDN